ncbi:MAG: D-aminoacyl-tRNA deacylase [bacterium]
MRAIVQRVSEASVSVKNEVESLREINKIKRGLVVLLGVGRQDSEEDAEYLAEKISNLRIFPDENDRMNLSVLDVKGEVLVISQFTLYGDCRKGRRPDFTSAAPPEMAEDLYEKFIEKVKAKGVEVKSGEFQARMLVDIHNDGPVTILLETKS